ncbi:uncharacterized protein [Eleutherodactylus coqui]|uniref:uncharacterized protein isoform X2 n=1 Tax=Eleutherodactylus coqui TaxID=57060 RepID=UPI0034624A2B
MSCPSFPHPSCPSPSDLPTFPVINCTSSSFHGDASIVTKSDSSSVSALNSSSMAPQDCSSVSELASSMSQLNFSYSTSSRSQGACSPISLENRSSIPDCTISTLMPTYRSKSQTEDSPSLILNGTSAFHTPNCSSSPMNCSSASQPASCNNSPLKCSCQTESSSVSCQNYTSVSQMTYSSQNCILKSSSLPQMNVASTSRIIDYSVSPLDSSFFCVTPPLEDPSDFSSTSMSDCSISSVHGESSTLMLNCQPTNQHAETAEKCHNKSPSDEGSTVNFTCVCTFALSNNKPPGISSPHFTSSSHHPCCSLVRNCNVISSSADSSLHQSAAPSLCPCKSPYTSQTPNCLDRSHNIIPINGITPSQINATTHPCGKFTSNNCNNTYVDPLPPWSSTFPEIDVVSINDEISINHLHISGHHSHHLPTKSTCGFSLPNYADSSANCKVLNSPSDTFPASDSTCPNSTDQTVFTSILEEHPKMLSSCPPTSSHGARHNCDPILEEEIQVQEWEVCKALLENKAWDQDRQLCEHFLDSLSRFEDWLQIAQITTTQGNSFKTLHQEVKLALRKYEVLLTEMREKLLDLESLNRQYWRLARTSQQTVLPSVLRSRMQEVNILWDSLQGEAETLHKTLKSRVQQREEFETDQDDMKLCLTEMDLELSNVEYIYGGNSTEKIQQLKGFQEDVWSNMKKVEGLLERGNQLIDNSDPRDAADLEVEMTELGSYCQQIYIRLSRLQKRLVSTKLVFEDDFLDSAVEHLSSGSSDVFLDLDIQDSDVSSQVNVPLTNAALPVDLEWDPLGDVGTSSSHDGQESFYTATSTPWKLPRKSEGSRSSLSSYSAIIYSNLRKEMLKEPLEVLHTNCTPPPDSSYLEWTLEPIPGQGQMENASVMHKSLLQLNARMGQDLINSSDEPDSEHRMDRHFAFPVYSWKATNPKSLSRGQVIDRQLQLPWPGQRRRPRRKKRMAQNRDTKQTVKPTKPEVSVLMESRDDLSHLHLHKTYRRSCSFCLWLRRLALVSVLLLVLVTSLLFPWGRQTCLSKSFSWSLMLTYVNGPPPT